MLKYTQISKIKKSNTGKTRKIVLYKHSFIICINLAILILRVNPNRTRLTLLELKEKCFVSEIHSSSPFNLIWIKKYFYAAKIKPSVVALSVFLKRVFGYKYILGIIVLHKYYIPWFDKVKVRSGLGGQRVFLFNELASNPDQLTNSKRRLQRGP